MKYFVDLNGSKFEVKTVDGHDTIYVGNLSDAGIEGDDPEYTNKLDNFLQTELGISPEEWEVG